MLLPAVRLAGFFAAGYMARRDSPMAPDMLFCGQSPVHGVF